jgi:dethiobiotin synthetase
MIVFVAGTGTGVGKTTFTTSWLRALREDGVDAVGWKPIETGGDEDQRAIAAAGGRAIPARHAYPTPVAAHRSAKLEGARIELGPLAQETRALAQTRGALIVETAGGLFSPLDDEGNTNAEIVASVARTGAPVKLVLVTANRLGVLHDVEAVRRALTASGLRLDAVIANLFVGLLDESVATNLEDLTSRVPCPVIHFDGDLGPAARRTLRSILP